MKCPRCRGIGSVPYHIDEDLFDETLCPVCHGSGEVEITNEEWLKSMNTEQFAEALAWIEDRGESPTVRKENVKAFANWLKQPHKDGNEKTQI